MMLVWIILFFGAAYFAYGLLTTNPNKRVFAGDLPSDEVVNGYLLPKEVIDDDEEELTKTVVDAFTAQTLGKKKDIGNDDLTFHEPHWGHTNGVLRGNLQINQIDNLPEAFRVGLFAQEAAYPVVARSGLARDYDLGFAINRLAVKLDMPKNIPNAYAASGEAPELDLLMVAGVSQQNSDNHTFFVRDGRQMAIAGALKPPSIKTLKMLSNWRNLALLLRVKKRVGRLSAIARTTPESAKGWAGKAYYGLGPFKLGDGAMKFRITPKQSHDVADFDPLKSDVTQKYKDNMDQWLNEGRTAEFTLSVQLATPDCIPEPEAEDPPKGVMAAEYCDIIWDETKSPFIDVGTLSLGADQAINSAELAGRLQFNSWNTYDCMRPLGQLFRARKHVHAAHSNVRVEHLYGGKPGEMVGKCPFAV